MFKFVKGGIEQWVKVFNKGAADSGVAILNTAIVVGFGGVVKNTQGFADLVTALKGMSMPPLVFVMITVAICAGACGSASGGMGVAFKRSDRYISCTWCKIYLTFIVSLQLQQVHWILCLTRVLRLHCLVSAS